MPTEPLWPNPDLGGLRSSAELIRDLVRAGDADAVELVREHHPRLGDLHVGDPRCPRFTLGDARWTVARRHGLPSWPELVRHLGVVQAKEANPHRIEADNDQDRFVVLACLIYGDDDATRWQRADAMAEADPSLMTATIWAAAVSGRVEDVRDALDRGHDPDEPGGPLGWPALLYAAYSRLPGADTVPVIRELGERGADPNAGFLWEGLTPPFTALTGVLGGGERHQPPLPRWRDAAVALLAAGADANDAQGLYNRGPGDRPSDDTEFLSLLFEHGLGRGDGGPWRRALAPRHPSPAELVAEALQHAAEAGLIERVRLLLANGADPNGRGTHPIFGGRTAYQGAVLRGHREIEGLLEAAGADVGSVDQLERMVGACLAPDRNEINRLLAVDPAIVARARAAHPGLVCRAAELGRVEAIDLLAGLGFDVDHGPVTGLHEAALHGHTDAVEVLLQLGADPTAVEPGFSATPAGWARHGGHPALADRLDRAAGAHNP